MPPAGGSQPSSETFNAVAVISRTSTGTFSARWVDTIVTVTVTATATGTETGTGIVAAITTACRVAHISRPARTFPLAAIHFRPVARREIANGDRRHCGTTTAALETSPTITEDFNVPGSPFHRDLMIS